MSQQQQTNPNIKPSLADLDKPAADVNPKDTPPTSTPTATPTPVTEDKNPTEVKPAVDPIEQARQAEAAAAAAAAEAAKKNEKPEGTEPEGDEDSEYDPMEIWQTVSKLRGDELKWEFPQGVEPDSPEAIHHAMQQIEDHSIDKFEQHLQRAYPRAYSYLLHISNGGTDEEFFQVKTEPVPDLEALKTSVDSQRAFYKRALQRRGITEEHADLIIKDAIEKNKLTALVESEHTEMKTMQERQMQELMEADKRNQEKQQRDIANMGRTLQEYILENKNLNITIPDAKRGEFLQFVNSIMAYDKTTGGFFVNQEISKENLGLVLEALYYMNVKGNMSEIITKKAQDENAKRLRIRMQKDKKQGSTQTSQQSSTNSKPGVMPALSEL